MTLWCKHESYFSLLQFSSRREWVNWLEHQRASCMREDVDSSWMLSFNADAHIAAFPNR